MTTELRDPGSGKWTRSRVMDPQKKKEIEELAKRVGELTTAISTWVAWRKKDRNNEDKTIEDQLDAHSRPPNKVNDADLLLVWSGQMDKEARIVELGRSIARRYNPHLNG